MAFTTEVPQEHTPLQRMLDQHLNWLQIKGYSDYTVRSRFVHIRFFLRWCAERRVNCPDKITASVLGDYQQHVFDYRKRNGEPLTLASRHARLVPLRVWFRWMAQQHLMASELINAIDSSLC